MARTGFAATDPAKLDSAIMEMIETPRPVIFDCVVGSEGELFPDDSLGQGAQRNAARRAWRTTPAMDTRRNVIDERGKMLV